MTRFQKIELWRELNATDESYVREKYALGGYRPCERPVVAEWVAERGRLHDRQQLYTQNNTTKRIAFWAVLSAGAAWLEPVIEAIIRISSAAGVLP